jgi:hypothetical protein
LLVPLDGELLEKTAELEGGAAVDLRE